MPVEENLFLNLILWVPIIRKLSVKHEKIRKKDFMRTKVCKIFQERLLLELKGNLFANNTIGEIAMKRMFSTIVDNKQANIELDRYI